MIVLGLNAFHGDSAACIVVDGALVAAAEEERFTRIKHWAGFPVEAARYCLTEAGVDLSLVDCVALNTDPRAQRARRIGFALSRVAHPRDLLEGIRRRRARASVRTLLDESDLPGRFSGTLQPVEHHLAHLASAFLTSPFDRAACVSVDGFGDFASAAWGTGEGGRISMHGRIHFPHSLGAFYQAITQYLGFPAYGDEYKVMGLASYGEPSVNDRLSRMIRSHPDGRFELEARYFRHFTGGVAYEWSGGAPRVGTLFSPEFERLLGPRRSPDDPIEPRHLDIARSAQSIYEKAFFAFLRTAHAAAGSDELALAGGCAMNSVANGRVYRHTPFRRLFVPPAAGDAGGAVGAALVASGCSRFEMQHAYWGPSFDSAAIEATVAAHSQALADAGCRVERIGDPDRLCTRIVGYLCEGDVVGWFQGRMEWGPRALGNRSILCDPRRSDMRERLNEKIKRRESFRPFAPVILRSSVADWFETDDDVPFMMKVFEIRPERRAEIPAVTHVDGTGRLQTVAKAQNPRLHALIEAFASRTGVPLLLNTSFNENEPIVCRPEEAIRCYLRTRMDVLVLGEHLITRGHPPAAGDDG